MQAKYKNTKGDIRDEDWTVAQIVKKIRSSDVFMSLPRKEKCNKSGVPKAKKELFETSAFYKKYATFKAGNKTTVLKRWRLRDGRNNIFHHVFLEI